MCVSIDVGQSKLGCMFFKLKMFPLVLFRFCWIMVSRTWPQLPPRSIASSQRSSKSIWRPTYFAEGNFAVSGPTGTRLCAKVVKLLGQSTKEGKRCTRKAGHSKRACAAHTIRSSYKSWIRITFQPDAFGPFETFVQTLEVSCDVRIEDGKGIVWPWLGVQSRDSTWIITEVWGAAFLWAQRSADLENCWGAGAKRETWGAARSSNGLREQKEEVRRNLSEDGSIHSYLWTF